MSEKEEGKEKIDKNVKKSNTEPKPESRSKVKAKPKTKDKKSEKPNQHKIILDPEFETRLREIDVKNVFKLNSNTKDEKILNGLIYLHKVIEYKCANDRCGIQGEWLGNPLELLLVHKNNKENDNRIKNLEYKCYNCYFQESGNISLFKKVKQDKIQECKICGFNLNKLGMTYRKLGICKICVNKHNQLNKVDTGLDLFSNTFDNSLTNEDLKFNREFNILSTEESMRNAAMLEDEKDSNKKKKKKPKKPRKQKEILVSKPSIDETLDININNINIDDIEEMKNIFENL